MSSLLTADVIQRIKEGFPPLTVNVTCIVYYGVAVHQVGANFLVENLEDFCIVILVVDIPKHPTSHFVRRTDHVPFFRKLLRILTFTSSRETYENNDVVSIHAFPPNLNVGNKLRT